MSPNNMTFIGACQQRLTGRPRFAKYHVSSMECQRSRQGYYLSLTLQGKWNRVDFERITTIIVSRDKPVIPDPQLGKFHNIVSVAVANAGRAVFTWCEEPLHIVSAESPPSVE